MSYTISKNKTNKTNTLFFMLLILTNFLILINTTKWNFEKKGDDWSSSCKHGKQAPIDISAPFTYKSKYFNN